MKTDDLRQSQMTMLGAVQGGAVDPTSWIAAEQGLSAFHRLAIYRHGYELRLLQCMQAEFPALARAFGSELFDDFAREYLKARPPTSYTLHDLGADFPLFIREHRPDRDAAVMDREPVFDFMEDLASLERTWSEVFCGPGLEEQFAPPVLDPLAAPPDQTRLAAAPCLRLLRLRFPLARFYFAARAGQSPEFPTAEPSYIAVTRRDYRVVLFELIDWEWALLKIFVDAEETAPVGDGLDAAAHTAKDDSGTFRIRAGMQLAICMERGFLLQR